MQTKINLEVNNNDTLLDLENAIKTSDDKIKEVHFHSIDGGLSDSFLPKSESLNSLENTPFFVRINNDHSYVISLGQKHSPIKQVTRADIFDPNEEAFHLYCKSIGIPNKDSETLASFLDKTYKAIPSQIVSTEDLKTSMFNALASFRSFPKNRWGTTRTAELKKILEQKEKDLVAMHQQKERLDKSALRRANAILYLGGTILIGQFSFIMGGTYLYFCWDVMEPMAYLMLTSNLAAAFTYFWWSHSELEFQPLQGRFKNAIARGIYRRNNFDYYKFKQLQTDVIELRDIINTSV